MLVFAGDTDVAGGWRLAGGGWFAPSPPTPLPRWWRGEDFGFLSAVEITRVAPLAPERGEGPGVRGEGTLGFRCFEPRMNTNDGVVLNHEWTRMGTNETAGGYG